MFNVGDRVECVDTQRAEGMIITVGYKGTVTFVAGQWIAVDGLFGREGRPVMYEGAFKLIEPVTEKSEPEFDPIHCRDRIKEIDSLVESLEEERVSLVQALKDERFVLISTALVVSTAPIEDMNDWRNWKAGDHLEIIGNLSDYEFNTGEIVKIGSLGGNDGTSISLYYLNDSYFWFADHNEVKFHSRPQ